MKTYLPNFIHSEENVIMQEIVDVLRNRVINVPYICVNAKYEGCDRDYYYFEAVDLANCESYFTI